MCRVWKLRPCKYPKFPIFFSFRISNRNKLKWSKNFDFNSMFFLLFTFRFHLLYQTTSESKTTFCFPHFMNYEFSFPSCFQRFPAIPCNQSMHILTWKNNFWTKKFSKFFSHLPLSMDSSLSLRWIILPNVSFISLFFCCSFVTILPIHSMRWWLHADVCVLYDGPNEIQNGPTHSHRKKCINFMETEKRDVNCF